MNKNMKKEKLLQLTKEDLVEVILMIEESKPYVGNLIDNLIIALDGSGVAAYFESFWCENLKLNNKAKLKLKTYVNEYGYNNVVEGIEIAILQYDDFNEAMNKLGGILYNRFGKNLNQVVRSK
jgi:hypothetical protein